MISELAGAEAAFNFEVGYQHDGLVVGRKGGGIVDVTVHGVPAHSGLAPEKGRSAVAEMCYKVLELEASRDIERGKLINCGMVSGGIGENAVPGEAKMSMGNLVFPPRRSGTRFWRISGRPRSASTLREQRRR